MSLMAVKMSEEVWLTCLAHSLTTETEEIMGLLFGDIQYVNGRGAIALIWGASPQVRSDRRKDRVEVQPEQLAAASAQAEMMTLTSGRTTRVIGWYHSHPHITVLPSHVDVRTQAMYQQLDPGFIGLIFSCFSEDAQKVGRIQVIAFQSLDGKQKNVSLIANSSLIELESSWCSSERSSSESTYMNHFEDTCDSIMIKSTKVGRGPSDSFNNNAHDVDSMDMTASMQEALHRSNMDVSGAEYVRKEVPLEVMPSKAMLKLDSPLASFVDMQNVLFEEERTAYNQGILQNIRNGKIHPLTYIHHTSTYQASLCKLMEYCLSPAINTLQAQLKENEIRLAQLAEEAKSLELEALALKKHETNMNSHHNLLSHSPRGSSSPRQPDVRATVDSYDARSPGGTRSRRKTP